MQPQRIVRHAARLTFFCTLLVAVTAHAQFSFSKIVDTDDPVPGRPGQTFAIPGGTAGMPAVQGNSAVFSSFESDGTRNIQVLWAANINTGALTRVVDSNVPIPGGSGIMGYVSPFTINTGVVAFRGNNVDYRDATTPAQVGFWSVPTTGSPLQKLVNQDTAVPFADPNDPQTFGVNSFFDIGTFNLDNNHFVFSNGATYAATVGGSGVTRVADKHTPIAEANYGGGGFSIFASPDISGNTVAFTAGNVFSQNAIYTAPRSGLVVGTGGVAINATRIASRNSPHPGGGRFGDVNFGVPVLDGDTVVFRAVNDPTDNPGDEVPGLYSSVGGVLHKLVDSQTPVPGGTGNFQANGSFDAYSLSGDRVMFKAIDGNNTQGLYLVPARGGVIQKIIAEGEQLSGQTVVFSQPPIQFNSLDGRRLVFRPTLGFEGAIYLATLPAHPTLSINNAPAFNEGSAANPGSASFTVTLSGSTVQTVTVNYQTADGTAKAAGDYVAKSGTLTFTPGGATTKTVTVVAKGDGKDEVDETFFVNLSNAANAVIVDAQGSSTILDDDPPPSLSINDVAVAEGNSRTLSTSFTVSLSAASAKTVTVNYATANGTAAAVSDYVAQSGTLSFAPGVTAKTIAIVRNSDAAIEPNETFFVNLSGAVNATLSDSQGRGTLLNDDGPTLSLSDAVVTEGQSGTKTMSFQVRLSQASAQTVTVQYATADISATAGSDYVAVPPTTLSFSPGQTIQTVTVTVNGDTVIEPNEKLAVNLSSAVGATLFDKQGIGTILNGDGPKLTIDSVSLAEGDSGTQTMSFTVTLAPASAQTVTVQYATANGTALAGSDYVAKSGTLTFAPGATTKAVNVTINGDTAVEPNETFLVNLSNAVGASIFDSQGVGTITNDDSAASESAPADSSLENDEASVPDESDEPSE